MKWLFLDHNYSLKIIDTAIPLFLLKFQMMFSEGKAKAVTTMNLNFIFWLLHSSAMTRSRLKEISAYSHIDKQLFLKPEGLDLTKEILKKGFPPLRCDHCGKPETSEAKYKCCARCKVAFYCS